jgi:hypothetical protein
LGLFPNLFLNRMQDSVSSLLDRYVSGRIAFKSMPANADAVLLPRRGGPLDRGYPKPPEAKKSSATALNDSGQVAAEEESP